VRVSWFGLKTKVSGFPSLGLKTGSCGLVIWPTKSPRRFFGLGLKTKRVMVHRLCHKTNSRMKRALDTRRDLAACFTRKEVGLGFPSLASRMMEARHGWCMWHHCRGRVEVKQKIVGLMVSGVAQWKSNKNTLH
jgi:hypothetical protein